MSVAFAFITTILLSIVIWRIVKYIGSASLNKNEQNSQKNTDNLGKSYKELLAENNLEQYIELFENNNLTEYDLLTELSEDDLEKLGIIIMGDRKRILKLFSVRY